MTTELAPIPVLPETALASTVGNALGAKAEADVRARFLMAMKRPRIIDSVRLALLRDCERPAFAKVARYAKPQGSGKVEGPSIRFVEAALRHFGNVATSASAIFDDATQRIVQIRVCDLEANITYDMDIVVSKTVERSNADGRQVLGQRINTNGKTVVIVAATDDELTIKQASAVSKAIRTCGLRLLPGDLVDEAQAAVQATRKNAAAKDPDAYRKQVVADFAEQGVSPEMLVGYLRHGLDTLTAAEGSHLWDLVCAMREGARWSEVIGEPVETPKPAPTQPRGAALGLPLGTKEGG